MAWARFCGPGDADAVCDAIASAIAKEYVRRDPNALLDIHVSGGMGALFVTGTVSSTADFDVASLVRSELGRIDPSLQVEPFITIEPMTEPRAFGGAEPWTATGIASAQSPEFYPEVYAFGLRCLRSIEMKRQNDPDWYWLRSEYAIHVMDQGDKRQVQVLVWHSDGITSDEVRVKLAGHFSALPSSKPLHVDVICQQGLHSLSRTTGASRQQRSLQYQRIPAPLQGAGYELRHPANLGQWYARAIARELVRSQQVESVALELDWYALEHKPRGVRALDQAGRDLSSLIDLDRCDLSAPPQGWDSTDFLTQSHEWSRNGDIHLPWES